MQQKNWIALLLCFIVISMFTTAFADSTSSRLNQNFTIQQSLRYTYIEKIIPSISTSNATLYPEVYVKAKNSSAQITDRMYLQKYTGGQWVSLSTWNFSGTGSAFISKTYNGVSGAYYRTKTSVTISNEQEEAISNKYLN